MTARFVRPISTAASWSRRLATFAFVLFLAVLVAHRIGALPMPDFMPAGALAGGLAALAVLLAVIGLVRLWQVGAKGGWAALAALLLSGMVLVPVAYMGWLWFERPQLYDLTTDFADPPDWIVAPDRDQVWMARPSTSDAMHLAQLSAYPEIAPHRYDGGIDRVLSAVKRTAADLKLRIVATTGVPQAPPLEPSVAAAPASAPPQPAKKPGIVPVPRARPQPPEEPPALVSATPPRPAVVVIQAAHRSLLLSLPSAVLIRLSEDAQTTVVDMRVQALYGDRDFGTGARLIDAFFSTLDNELQGAGG